MAHRNLLGAVRKSVSIDAGKPGLKALIPDGLRRNSPQKGHPAETQGEKDLQGKTADSISSRPTAKMYINLKSFEKIRAGRLLKTRKVGLPSNRVLFTVLRSPHIDKKSREQFEMKTRRQLVVAEMDTAKLTEKYNELKMHNVLGVQLKVTFHYQTRLDMSRIGNMNAGDTSKKEQATELQSPKQAIGAEPEKTVEDVNLL